MTTKNTNTARYGSHEWMRSATVHAPYQTDPRDPFGDEDFDSYSPGIAYPSEALEAMILASYEEGDYDLVREIVADHWPDLAMTDNFWTAKVEDILPEGVL